MKALIVTTICVILGIVLENVFKIDEPYAYAVIYFSIGCAYITWLTEQQDPDVFIYTVILGDEIFENVFEEPVNVGDSLKFLDTVYTVKEKVFYEFAHTDLICK